MSSSMEKIRRDFTPADLKREMEKVHFDFCVAVQARQTTEETRWLLELADRHSFIQGVVGWIDLRSPELREPLKGFASHPKLRGVRHVVQDEPDDRFLMRPDFLRGVEVLPEFNLTYDILIYEKHLPVALEFVKRFPDHRFVLDHIAKPSIRERRIQPWEDGIRAIAERPNVWCKLSGMVTEADWDGWKPEDLAPYLEVVMQCFGSDRLMIGSDWPVCTLAGDYVTVVKVVLDAISARPGPEQAAILGGNAQKFYGLSS